MEQILVTKRMIRKNKAQKMAQKEAKKRYKRVRGKAPHAKITKIVRSLTKDALYIKTARELNVKDTDSYTKEEILNVISSCRLKGLGGSGFLLIEKLRSLLASPCTSYSLVVNGAECDPGLLHDEWLTVHKKAEVLRGMQMLAKCIPLKDQILATKLPITETIGDIKIIQVPNRYPIGEEHILADYLLQQTVHKDIPPSEQGILVTNIQTVLSLYQAVITKKPPVSRYLTAANLSTGEAKVLCVPLNEQPLPILQQAFPSVSDLDAYIGGGSFYAHKITALDRITEETSLICYAKAPVFDDTARCKKCGACERNCPSKIAIKSLVQAKERGASVNLASLGVANCIACGACSYFCKAGKDLRELVQEAKESL